MLAHGFLYYVSLGNKLIWEEKKKGDFSPTLKKQTKKNTTNSIQSHAHITLLFQKKKKKKTFLPMFKGGMQCNMHFMIGSKRRQGWQNHTHKHASTHLLYRMGLLAPEYILFMAKCK